jgi:uncharacterized membrane protein
MEATPTSPSPFRLRPLWRWATDQEANRWRIPPILALLLVVALALRLYGVQWDSGNLFHPDERSIYMRVDCMYRVLTRAPSYADCTRDHPFQQIQPGFPSPTVFLDADRSPLNPHWFPLGSMAIYALLAIKLTLAPILTMDLGDLALTGRALAALADVGAIAMAYALGRRIYGQGAGLLAATLITFAAVHIQISHFYRPEPFHNLFTLASFWHMLNVLDRRRVRDSAWLGLFVGLTFATKASALPLLLPVAATYGYLWLRPRKTQAHALATLHVTPSPLVGEGGGEGYSSPSPSPEPSPFKEEGQDPQGVAHQASQSQTLEGLALRSLLTGIVAVGTYLAVTPYALLSFPEFLEWNLRELDIVRRAGIVPYTLQYVGAPKLAYEMQQTIVWGLGVPLGLLAWGGSLATLLGNLRRPKLPQTLLLLWAIPLLFTIASVQVKFLRYTFPLMPVFIIMGAGAAVQLLGWATRWKRQVGRAVAIAIGIVVAATLFWGLAFTSIYSHPHPAVQASHWLRANAPPGTTILTDNHWDEGIPDVGRYTVDQLPMFESDSVAKMESVAQKLAKAEYLVFYSNRTYGAIARAPDCYPYSSAYYRALFVGDLGYDLAASFSSYPSLLGVAFADDPFRRAGLPAPRGLEDQPGTFLTLRLGYADNDAITYDHPLTLVFKNAAHHDAQALLTTLLQTRPVEPPSRKDALLLTADEQEAQQSGGTWSELFNPSSLSNRFPVLAWLLLVEAASLAAWPLAHTLFRGLHDRGYLLTKVLAVLLLAYLPWAMAALKLLPYTRTTIYLGLLALAGVSAAILVQRRGEMVGFLRSRWRGMALQEALFLAAFLAFMAIRWANPDLWHPYRGGEKPMDLAYLNAIIRSTTVPPYDPWFAGGFLNYYYFGQFIVATLIKATGILPEVAYNLAVPLMFALTVGGAFSVAYNLAHALRDARAGGKGPAWGPTAAGVAAALMVAVLGNMGSAVQVAINTWNPLSSGAGFPPFDFWSPSRMMPGQISITEFPFWTFLFADLHAHLIAIPFGLLAAGLALNLVGIEAARRSAINKEASFEYGTMTPSPLAGEGGGEGYASATPRPEGAPLPSSVPSAVKGEGTEAIAHLGVSLAKGGDISLWHSWRFWELALPVGFLALVVGALAAINTWDYPPYLLLGAAAIFLAWYGVRRRIDRPTLLRTALWGAAFVALSYALFLPYHLRNSAFGAGVHSSLQKTNILHYLAIHALFLFIVVSFLLYEARGYLMRVLRPLRWLLLLVKAPRGQAAQVPRPGRVVWVLAGFLALALLSLLAAGYGTVAFLFLLTAVALLLAMRHLARGRPDAPHQVFLLTLLMGALGVGMGVDLVTVAPDIDRMNTVFKLYLEAWVLFGVASAVMLWRIATLRIGFRGAFVFKGLWLAALALLVLASAIFPALGTRARLADRFSTDFHSLNGAQFMQAATYYDANGPIDLRYDWEGIQWLRANAQGSPVVAEGNTDPHRYRWGSRVSIYTGLPTIIGWGWHQTQQRMEAQDAVRHRLEQVQALFTTREVAVAADILKAYRVHYIYIGRLERLYYPAEGLAKFDDMADAGVHLVYQNPEVRIYEVAP